MTMTPKPSPVPQTRQAFLMICDGDGCKKYIEVIEDDTLPGGWREVQVEGWGGAFHACSEACSKTVNKRLKIKKGDAP